MQKVIAILFIIYARYLTIHLAEFNNSLFIFPHKNGNTAISKCFNLPDSKDIGEPIIYNISNTTYIVFRPVSERFLSFFLDKYHPLISSSQIMNKPYTLIAIIRGLNELINKLETKERFHFDNHLKPQLSYCRNELINNTEIRVIQYKSTQFNSFFPSCSKVTVQHSTQDSINEDERFFILDWLNIRLKSITIYRDDYIIEDLLKDESWDKSLKYLVCNCKLYIQSPYENCYKLADSQV